MQTNTAHEPMNPVTKVRIMNLLTDQWLQRAHPKLADRILTVLLKAEKAEKKENQKGEE